LFGLSLSSLALTGAQNVFTQNNTFQNNVTINGNLEVDQYITGSAGNPVEIKGTGGTYDLAVFNTAGVLVFSVADSGAVNVPDGNFSATGYVNSGTGFRYNGGAGTAGQCLVSNGAYFVPGTCGSGGTTTQYYQSVYNNTVGVTQRAVLNIAPRLTAADNAVAGYTTLDLATTGVTPGTYTSSNITVDAFGRITAAASNGTTGPVIRTVKITSVCGTSGASYASCPNTINWLPNFADANYIPQCTAGTPTGQAFSGLWIDPSSVSASGMTVYIQNGTSDGAHPISVTAIYCTGIHL